jgi:PIN domain nuclease of toxin-antitoxin system
MTTYLLDTHTLIWFLENNPQLPSKTRTRIENSPTVFISIISLWEIAIKANIGKLNLQFSFNDLETELTTQNITQLPITFNDLKIYYTLPLHHRDPFDRLLIAQSMNHALPFISRDTEFKPYPIQQIWD